jgi:hypothetical protein
MRTDEQERWLRWVIGGFAGDLDEERLRQSQGRARKKRTLAGSGQWEERRTRGGKQRRSGFSSGTSEE